MHVSESDRTRVGKEEPREREGAETSECYDRSALTKQQGFPLYRVSLKLGDKLVQCVNGINYVKMYESLLCALLPLYDLLRNYVY